MTGENSFCFGGERARRGRRRRQNLVARESPATGWPPAQSGRRAVSRAPQGHKIVAGGNAPGKREASSPTLKGSYDPGPQDARPE